MHSFNLSTDDKLSLGDVVDVNRLLVPAKEKVDGLAGTEFNEDEVALEKILEDRLECVIWLTHPLTSFEVGSPLFNSFSPVCNTGLD